MTRKIHDIKTEMMAADIVEVVEKYLETNGFSQQSYEGDYMHYSRRPNMSRKGPTGEQVWRRGRGTLFSPLFLKFEAKDGNAHFETWGLSWQYGGWPVGGRVGEGILQVPGLKRCLRDIEELLQKVNPDVEALVRRKRPFFIPYAFWRRRPFTWYGWAMIISIALWVFLLVLNQKFG